mmetsp:Transcript_12992/g.28089  ORF Transcript_12992/g.28089 Transcript_12992/m.28089 type:complete len:221 (-) Transcript_12992:137-799(-)
MIKGPIQIAVHNKALLRQEHGSVVLIVLLFALLLRKRQSPKERPLGPFLPLRLLNLAPAAPPGATAPSSAVRLVVRVAVGVVVITVTVRILKQRAGFDPLADHDLILRAILQPVVFRQFLLPRDIASRVNAHYRHFGRRSGTSASGSSGRENVGRTGEGVVQDAHRGAGEGIRRFVEQLRGGYRRLAVLDHADYAVYVNDDASSGVVVGDAGRHDGFAVF